MSHKNTKSNIPARGCGDCIACCTYLAIPEVEKSGLAHCRHSTVPDTDGEKLHMTGTSDCGNCSIHDSKPKPCREYACLWLAGYGKEEDRPDRSGMLIDTIHRIGNAIEAKPIRDGADTTTEGAEAIIRASVEYGAPALVTTWRETRLARVVGEAVKWPS